jgi:hypothetical protein
MKEFLKGGKTREVILMEFLNAFEGVRETGIIRKE